MSGREVLKEVGNPGLRDWTRKVRVLPRGLKLLPAQIDADVLDAVYTSLLEEKRLGVSYTPRGESRAKQYAISPLGLVVREALTYVVGTLWDYPEPMHFAVHRMKKAEVLDKPCNIPNDFDLDDHIKTGEFSYPVSARNIKLEALFDKDAAIHLYETRLSDDQQLTSCRDGRVSVKATVKDTQELRWWLLGFGEQMEVRKPVELRQHFKSVARHLIIHYE
ncbi:MAG: helix-turn-helix transcriptional regulator [Gammaproteobacteria bacterium]